MVHPLDQDNTRSRLDKIEMTQEHMQDDLHKLTGFLSLAEPWLQEWVGRGPQDPGIRNQVLKALDERKAMSIGGQVLNKILLICASLAGIFAALWAILHSKGGA